MAANETILPTVLDRLLDGERGAGRTGIGIGVRELKESVARDLEWLLNSHQSLPERARALAESRTSNLAYGLPDYSQRSWTNQDDAEAMCEIIEEVVRTFEPRFAPRSIQVRYAASERVDDFRMRFRIDAVLRVEPLNEPVSYDTDFEPATGAIEVSRAD